MSDKLQKKLETKAKTVDLLFKWNFPLQRKSQLNKEFALICLDSKKRIIRTKNMETKKYNAGLLIFEEKFSSSVSRNDFCDETFC